MKLTFSNKAYLAHDRIVLRNVEEGKKQFKSEP